MKKSVILLAALCLFALSACSVEQSNTGSATGSTGEPAASQSGEPTTAPSTVQGHPAVEVDQNEPTGTFAVAFDASSIHQDGDTITMDLKLYTYETFDAVEVTQLKVGDTIIAAGQTIQITEIEELENGDYNLNGGYEKNGITLAPDDGGTYRQTREDDAYDYQEIGAVTLPLSDQFELLDNAENANRKLTAKEMANLKDGDIPFTEHNTTVTVEGGKILHIDRVYTP